MANFFKPAVFNNLVAGLTAVAFTTAVVYSPQVHAVDVNLDLAAINFGVKAAFWNLGSNNSLDSFLFRAFFLY